MFIIKGYTGYFTAVPPQKVLLIDTLIAIFLSSAGFMAGSVLPCLKQALW